jgi:hypothetical protein
MHLDTLKLFQIEKIEARLTNRFRGRERIYPRAENRRASKDPLSRQGGLSTRLPKHQNLLEAAQAVCKRYVLEETPVPPV